MIQCRILVNTRRYLPYNMSRHEEEINLEAPVNIDITKTSCRCIMTEDQERRCACEQNDPDDIRIEEGEELGRK
ncbi:hypothetical protein F2P81_006795 [Scophthalmus maximus]|uniref:Uncharacterized protein n=1 Tax=Scophthalmus maximus TaxID=52904 RepID=A0A6A4T408_SCOMX|nr:hypothetical protein F2P81_006795 [Scophthalmus maximus]